MNRLRNLSQQEQAQAYLVLEEGLGQRLKDKLLAPPGGRLGKVLRRDREFRIHGAGVARLLSLLGCAGKRIVLCQSGIAPAAAREVSSLKD